MRVGEVMRRTLIHVQDLVLAEADQVAVAQRMAANALGTNHHAIGAVEVFDDAHTVAAGDDLAVMAADEFAVDLQIVIGGAPDDLAPGHEVQFGECLAIGR